MSMHGRARPPTYSSSFGVIQLLAPLARGSQDWINSKRQNEDTVWSHVDVRFLTESVAPIDTQVDTFHLSPQQYHPHVKLP